MNPKQAETTNQSFFSPTLVRLLSQRGIGKDKLHQFLSWDLNSLPDFSILKDINKAALRIIKAINFGEKIGVYGDYDVDGTTSCALLTHFFRSLNIEIQTFQPSRFTEGYGLHESSIDIALAQDVKLLITVDCGITSIDAAKKSFEEGLDLIITDHHQDGATDFPQAFAVINPNRRDEPKQHPLKHLAGVGVAFALAWEIKKELQNQGRQCPSLYPLLPFVAIGTICDMAFLDDTNRLLTKHGLRQLSKSEIPGLRVFLSPEEKQLPMISSEKCSFQIGPMINSKGRLEHPELALKLLTTPDLRTAEGLYVNLKNCNDQRKMIQAKVYKEAKDQVIQHWKDPQSLCLVYAPHWHEGVIGIVASKLVETFKLPAIVFTDSETPGVIKGSARSAGELDLFSLLDSNRDLFIKFGGHKAAAGLSLELKNLNELRARIEKDLRDIPEIIRTVISECDSTLPATEITPKLLKELALLEPFGMGNKKPIFKFDGLELHSYQERGTGHIQWNFSGPNNTFLKGMSFNYLGRWNTPTPEELISLKKVQPLYPMGTLGINHYKGNQFIQLQIDHFEI